MSEEKKEQIIKDGMECETEKDGTFHCKSKDKRGTCDMRSKAREDGKHNIISVKATPDMAACDKLKENIVEKNLGTNPE